MIAENFVVKGSFFAFRQNEEDIVEHFKMIREKVDTYCFSQGYTNVTPEPFFGRYGEMRFDLAISPTKPNNGLLSKLKRNREDPYFAKLRVTRKGTPWTVKIYFYPGTYQNINGFNIDIISEPAIFFQIDQLGFDTPIDSKDYSFITYPNIQFVHGLAKAMLWSTITEPRPLQYYLNTELTLKLRKYNFEKPGDLLEKGSSKIEMGASEDGLTDLRSAIEIFLVELVNHLGQKPHPQDKVEANIEILEKMGYLDGKMKGLIVKTLVNGVWSKISDTATHKREPFNLFDARLCYNITEEIFDYFIEKIVRYNIKTSHYETKPKTQQ